MCTAGFGLLTTGICSLRGVEQRRAEMPQGNRGQADREERSNRAQQDVPN